MNAPESAGVRVHDFGPAQETFLADVLAGLADDPKTLPCKYFYDQRGSELFDEICELDEYYLTRTEQAILDESAGDIARTVGPECLLIEPGSGSSTKTRTLIDHLERPAAYVPIDISREHLRNSARRIKRRYPDLEVLPVCADFNAAFEWPRPARPFRRRLIFFPGSTIGNFAPEGAVKLLTRMARLCEAGGAILIGVDLKKPRHLLERAYNDRQQVTAAFNLNLLQRINRELGGDFDVDRFDHRAIYNADDGRIEMHLVSREEQEVTIDDAQIEFAAGESIRTECSYKYGLEEFASLAAEAGLHVEQVWTDPEHLFSVQLLVAK